jgi:hypothetical protein
VAQLSTLDHDRDAPCFIYIYRERDSTAHAVFGSELPLAIVHVQRDDIPTPHSVVCSGWQSRFFHSFHFDDFWIHNFIPWPNKSPEPTVVGACGSSLSRWLLFGLVPRWLSFFR